MMFGRRAASESPKRLLKTQSASAAPPGSSSSGALGIPSFAVGSSRTLSSSPGKKKVAELASSPHDSADFGDVVSSVLDASGSMMDPVFAGSGSSGSGIAVKAIGGRLRGTSSSSSIAGSTTSHRSADDLQLTSKTVREKSTPFFKSAATVRFRDLSPAKFRTLGSKSSGIAMPKASIPSDWGAPPAESPVPLSSSPAKMSPTPVEFISEDGDDHKSVKSMEVDSLTFSMEIGMEVEVEVESDETTIWRRARILDITSRAIIVGYEGPDGKWTEKVFRDPSRIRQISKKSSTASGGRRGSASYSNSQSFSFSGSSSAGGFAGAPSSPRSKKSPTAPEDYEPSHSSSAERPAMPKIEARSVEEAVDKGICRFFLMGACKHKGDCRSSHRLLNCVYCFEKLPSRRVSASAHLRKCWKASRTGLPLPTVPGSTMASPSSGVDSLDSSLGSSEPDLLKLLQSA